MLRMKRELYDIKLQLIDNETVLAIKFTTYDDFLANEYTKEFDVELYSNVEKTLSYLRTRFKDYGEEGLLHDLKNYIDEIEDDIDWEAEAYKINMEDFNQFLIDFYNE